MIPARSYSEPLRSHIARRRRADLRTAVVAVGLACAVAFTALAIGHVVLKAALNATTPPMIECC